MTPLETQLIELVESAITDFGKLRLTAVGDVYEGSLKLVLSDDAEKKRTNPMNRDMKTAFKDDANTMYQGRSVSFEQLRDLARMYSMGWCSALLAQRDVDPVRHWAANEGRELASIDWMPDDSWAWWIQPAG